MIIVAVDPGATGGIAWVECKGDAYAKNYCVLLHAIPMPLLMPAVKPRKGKRKSKAKVKKAVLDGMELGNHLFNPVGEAPSYAIIENVHSMPRMGAPSMFQFGRMFGGAEAMLLAAFGASGLLRVQPHQWKEALQVPADKTMMLNMANHHFPGAAEKFWPIGPRGGETTFEGVAEAALLGVYAHRNLEKLLAKRSI